LNLGVAFNLWELVRKGLRCQRAKYRERSILWEESLPRTSGWLAPASSTGAETVWSAAIFLQGGLDGRWGHGGGGLVSTGTIECSQLSGGCKKPSTYLAFLVSRCMQPEASNGNMYWKRRYHVQVTIKQVASRWSQTRAVSRRWMYRESFRARKSWIHCARRRGIDMCARTTLFPTRFW